MTPRTAGRPPYAVDEALFLRLCDGCARCVSACEKALITIERSVAALDVSYAACDRCGACQHACSTLALSQPATNTGLIARVANSCENLGGYCDSCEQACSHGALNWQVGAKPKIEAQRCLGCGQCVSHCYTQAIHCVVASG